MTVLKSMVFAPDWRLASFLARVVGCAAWLGFWCGLPVMAEDATPAAAPLEAIDEAQRQLAERRGRYERDMAATIESWRQRIAAHKAGLEGTADAWRALETAWQQVESRWEWFQGGGRTTWQETRAALERDLDRLEQVWEQTDDSAR